MEVRLHFLLRGQAFERIALEHRGVTGNLAQDLWRQNEETAIDPAALALRLLLERIDGGLLDAQRCRIAPGAVSP